MKKFVLILAITLLHPMNHQVFAQAIRGLVLVMGDTAHSQKCSFISSSELETVPIAQRLLALEEGLSPQQVAEGIGFTPDNPNATDVLYWTTTRGRNYIRVTVDFRQKSSIRSLTLATNYKQPNEKRCSWQVKQLQDDVQTFQRP